MPVRNTESRLPDGLAAEHLGQGVTAGTFVLVSYLESPLRHHADHKPIRNRYVLFDTNGASEPNDYRWKIKFEFSNSADVELQDLNGIEGGAVFELDLSDSPFSTAVDGKNLTGITVTVDTDSGQELELDQDVTALLIEIESLIANFDNESGAHAGEPGTTRILANDYRQYFLRLNSLDAIDTNEISLNLIATLVYQAVESDSSFFSRLSRFFVRPDEEKWIDYINGTNGVGAEDLIGTKISLMNIKPHVFHFMREDPNGGYIILEDMNVDKDVEKYEANLLTRFHALPATTKIDVFNMLRFPKLCFASVWRFLSLIKGHHVEFLANILDRENHANNRECISTIVTEFETVPQDQLDAVSSTAVQAYDIMYSKWMQAILNASLILRLKVLDVRSGRPVTNARLRKLIVYGTKGNTTSKFGTKSQVDLLYERDRINEPDALRGAQIALLRLGYAPPGTQRTLAEEQPAGWCDGVWGGQSSQAYNEYWQDRIIDITEIATTGNLADRPSDADLRAIVNDYNAHAYSDDQGVVEIRVPKVFLDEREVFFDVQFWEFPALLEETGNAGSLSRSSNRESIPTDFSVEWTGGDGSNQRSSWSDYVGADDAFDLNVRFGWRVTHGVDTEELRAVNRIRVKNGEGRFEGLDESLLSKFYDIDSYPVHFVVFGMVWCQPVWDDFDDPDVPAVQDSSHVYITQNVYCNDDSYNLLTIDGYTDNAVHSTVGRHLHIVSNVNMRTDEPLRQKGYGVVDNRPVNARGTGHSGYDIYNIDDDPAFAPHGGQAESRFDNDLGHYTRVMWGQNRIDLAHFRAANPRPAKFPAENTNPRSFIPIMAGEVVGYAGWSGNLDDNQPQHTHVRYRTGPRGGPWAAGVTTLNDPPAADDPNRLSIPHNELALIIPCRSNYAAAAGVPRDCEFQDTVLVRFGDRSISRCFAPIEVCCPFMNVAFGSAKAPQKIQAQLKHMFVRSLDPLYMDPGRVDGDIAPALANINNVPTADLNNGRAVVRLGGTRHDGRLIQIRHTQDDGQRREGWIEASLINAANELEIPAFLGVNSLSSIINVPVGTSRMAIYMFRRANGLLDFVDYRSNFSVDNQAWLTLDAIAPIRTPV